MAKKSNMDAIPAGALQVMIWAKGFELARLALIIGGVVWCMSYLSDIVAALAGRRTDAKLLFEAVFIQSGNWLPWLAGGSGAGYGYAERRLRKKKTEQLQSRIQELETRIDPNRQSSELTPQGDTNPVDRG